MSATARLDRLDSAAEPVVAGLCGYEALAIYLPALPTLSTLSRVWRAASRRSLGPVVGNVVGLLPAAVLVTWLAVHLVRPTD